MTNSPHYWLYYALHSPHQETRTSKWKSRNLSAVLQSLNIFYLQLLLGTKKTKSTFSLFCFAQKMPELFSFPSDCNPEIVPPPIFSPSMTLSFSHLLSTLPKVFVCQNKKLHFLEYQKNVFFVAISHC